MREFLDPRRWLRAMITRQPMPHFERIIPGAQSEGHVSEQHYKRAAEALNNPDAAEGLRTLKTLFRDAEVKQRKQEQARWRPRVRLISSDGKRAQGSA